MSAPDIFKDMTSASSLKSKLTLYYLFYSIPFLFMEVGIDLFMYMFFGTTAFMYSVVSKYSFNLSVPQSLFNIFHELKQNPNHNNFRRIALQLLGIYLVLKGVDLFVYYNIEPNVVVETSPSQTGAVSSSSGDEGSIYGEILLYFFGLVFSLFFSMHTLSVFMESAAFSLNSMLNTKGIEEGKRYRPQCAATLFLNSHKNALTFMLLAFALIFLVFACIIYNIFGYQVIILMVFLPMLIYMSAVVIDEMGAGKYQHQEESESEYEGEYSTQM